MCHIFYICIYIYLFYLDYGCLLMFIYKKFKYKCKDFNIKKKRIKVKCILWYLKNYLKYFCHKNFNLYEKIPFDGW